MNPTDPLRWRIFEGTAWFLIGYSILSYILEMELGHDSAPDQFWFWNEAVIVAFFTVEYFVRWWESEEGWKYPITALALIDLMAILPFYLAIFIDYDSLAMLRVFRLCRMFKLVRYQPAALHLWEGLAQVKHELFIIGYVVLLVILFSSILMFEFEREVQPELFGTPTDAMWWCVVTLTTVGYGDLAPATSGGRIVAVCTMLVGLGIFGTFISLIGSSFIASMKTRHEMEAIIDADGEEASD